MIGVKEIYKKIKSFYYSGNNELYFSLIPPFVMGTIHLIFVLINFDWIVLNYSIFYYVLMLIRVWQWFIEKYNLKPNVYISGVISMVLLIIPMMASFVLTIRFKDAPHYIFDWIIYAYALYAVIKMIFAVKKRLKKDKTNREYIVSWFSIIGALYTIQMMEFALISTFSNQKNNEEMYILELFTQGAIFIFSIFIIILFIKQYIRLKKVNNQA